MDLYNVLPKIETENIIAWILNNGIKNERGVPITFDKHSFMIDPYLDWTPEQGCRKASQCGWSVMTNIKLLYASRHGIPGSSVTSANIIYTLPSDSDVNDFVPTKTNLLIANNPIIKEFADEDTKGKDVDSVRRKQIGLSSIYFKGTRSKTAALMITSDVNIHDESDRSDPNIIDQYSSRVTASPFKGRWIFSNPSAPNMPADLLYQQSDQKHWFIKCEYCGHWQYLDWKKLSEYTLVKSEHCFIDDENGLFVCSGCAAPISDENRRRGRWVRKYTNRSVSGYWVSHLMYSWITCQELLDTEANKSKDYFMNFVLGLPYVGSDVVVDAQTIINNMELDEVKWTPGQVAMGVDNGDVKHFVIGDARGIFQIGKTKSWDDIEMLIRKFQPVTVIDLNPYPARVREICRAYRRVYASFYKQTSKDFGLVDWGEKENGHMVYPVRDRVFDDMINYIVDGKMKFRGSKAYYEEYIAHWETMYRADMVGTRKANEVGQVNRDLGVVRGVWQSSTGMDHYAHATLYYYVALSKLLGGAGAVLRGGATSPMAALQREVGRIPTVPDINNGIMTPHKSFIPDLSKLNQTTRKSGAMSDTIK